MALGNSAGYQSKLMSLSKAIGLIRPGESIWISSGSAVPSGLLPGLVSEDASLGDNEILHLLTLGDAPYVRPEFKSRFRHNALFIGPNVRSAVAEGRADYTPVFLSEIPGLIRSGRIRIDVALISVTPPDRDGYVSLGTHIDIAYAALDTARLVIAEVNPRMPWTCGQTRVHLDQIHALVECEHPLPELRPNKVREETEQIARHIAELIPDGATLQLGIGGIPDGVLRYLRDRKDLGIHTEMFSDGVVELAERGVITGRAKTLHPGKIVASFVMGTQRAYDFLDRNEQVELYPVDYVNDPFVVAQNERMVAVNTCLEIDLTGQVCSDSIGAQFYSGIGGQVDFIRGAARSKGGKPIIAVPATARDGIVSRIVPRLGAGAGVVTTRGDVHWVVTEYGAVNLHGLNVRERAMALISIAHPKFRPWLLSEAKRLNFVYHDQIEVPIEAPVYPKELEFRATTKDGRFVLIRPIKPTDESLLRGMFYRLSQETIYKRFFAFKKYMPHENLQRFCTIDYRENMTLVATVPVGDNERVVALGTYDLLPSSGLAEVAVVVDDDFQGKGLGTILVRRLAQLAQAVGAKGFTANVLRDNRPMLRVFEKCGYMMETVADGELRTLRILFHRPAERVEPAGTMS